MEGQVSILMSKGIAEGKQNKRSTPSMTWITDELDICLIGKMEQCPAKQRFSKKFDWDESVKEKLCHQVFSHVFCLPAQRATVTGQAYSASDTSDKKFSPVFI